MDKFLELTVFSTVATEGSFTRAAEILQMSRPSVSRQVAALEERLNTRLLHRSTRRVTLTMEGKAFDERCKEALAIVQDAECEISGNTKSPNGLLKLTIPSSFGLYYLAPVWSEFISTYPNVTLDVDLSDRPVDLGGEGYDAGLRIGERHTPDLVRKKLATIKQVLCASPQYISRNGMPQHPNDLVRHFTAAAGRAATDRSWQFTNGNKTFSVDIKPRICASSGEICRAAAIRHQTIILEPEFLVDRDLREGSLINILPDYPAPELSVYVVYPSRKHVSPKVRAFIAFMSNAFSIGLSTFLTNPTSSV
ncbi:LysR family transcriptional regulator [Agrobacterium sp. LAD9]|uniref:LysR family transcriptional regulator n=1 Tax=Agrobacterium sp. LAD9 TaxID=2055153 RepID=UPI001863AC95|nr:LysR family transcriptional regulator [Agrobacterium sp. LAD9]